MSTITCRKLVNLDDIQRARSEYLSTLIAPTDGMWENVAIARSTFWELHESGQRIGHVCVGADNCLLRFHLVEKVQVDAQRIFRWVVSTFQIEIAIAATIEPLYCSLCLDVQSHTAIHNYLFRDLGGIAPLPHLGNLDFRQAKRDEADELIAFYRVHTDGPSEWIEGFVSERLSCGELFGLYDGESVIVAGECIPSRQQRPYADLGVIVAQPYRGRGLGTSMLLCLKAHCYRSGLKPICSCAADNQASKRAIEKAGLVAEHRMLKMHLSM